jgi:hypothetical protein
MKGTKGETTMLTTMTLKEAVARRDEARRTYADAVKRFRRAYAELYALDRLLEDSRRVNGNHGFGDIPDVISLRHANVNPDEGGSIAGDAHAIVISTRIEG